MGKRVNKKMAKAAVDMPKPKTKSKFVRVTPEEAARLRVHTYPYII